MSEAIKLSLGETVLFVPLAVMMTGMAIYGLLLTRRPVHSAASMITVMVGFAFLYTMLEAPFMGVVQVAVYTGAILMMFLFVLMMIGVDSTDSRFENLPGQRWIAGLGAIGIAAIAAGVVLRAKMPGPFGMKEANGGSNPTAVATGIFGSHLVAMELAGSLLVVAALGAMVLTHRESVRKRLRQEEIVDAKMEAYATRGRHLGQKPRTGVYAESNSAANPALTHGGEIVEEAAPRMLRVRGQANRIAEISPAAVPNAIESAAGKVEIARSRMPGMPGEAAPAWPAEFMAAGPKARPAQPASGEADASEEETK